MKSKKVGWNDILTLARNNYLAQVTPGAIRWPAACNPRDSKAAPANFGHLAQLPGPTGPPNGGPTGGYQGRNQRNSTRNRDRGRKTGNRRNGGNPGNRPRNPRFVPPAADAKPISQLNGHPVYEKLIDNKKMEWCKFCKRWTNTHNSGSHTHGRNRRNDCNRNPRPAATAGLSFIPDPSLWLAAAACLPVTEAASCGARISAWSASQRGLPLAYI